MVSGEPMPARRANLGVMFDCGRIGSLRLTLWDGGAILGQILAGKARIEHPGAMGKHGSEISMNARVVLPGSSPAGSRGNNTLVLDLRRQIETRGNGATCP